MQNLWCKVSTDNVAQTPNTTSQENKQTKPETRELMTLFTSFQKGTEEKSMK